jgi:peptide subunit release factor 1 (eRF1)
MFEEDDNNKPVRNAFIVEPPRPIKQRSWSCDRHFRIDLIEDLFKTYDDYGVIDIQGEYTTYYTLNGDSLKYLTKISVDLPSNHDQGGQSQNRIQRQRVEKIHEYLKKVNHIACQKWIKPQTDSTTEEIKIKGLILSGTANKKDDFLREKLLDFRLERILLGKVVRPELESLKALIHQDQIKKNQEIYVSEIERNLNENPERLVFGREIYPQLKDRMIKLLIINKCWIDHKKEHPNYHLFQEELDNNQSTNLVIIPNYDPLQTQIDSFGGIIGIKWY